MAHFAELNAYNIVQRVLVVHNNELLEDGQEVEAKGIEFLQGLFGLHTKWVQTSYNANFRARYAGIGDMYDEANDVFLAAGTFEPPVIPDPVVQEPALSTEGVPSLTVEEVNGSEQTVVLETQATVMLDSSGLAALTSADIPALTSEQISGLE